MKTRSLFCMTFVLALSLTMEGYAQNGGTLINPFIGIAGKRASDNIETPSFGGSVEFFLGDNFSLGGIATYSTVSPEVSFTGEDSETSGFSIGALANYHWTDSDTFNFYTGGSLGYDTHNGPYTDGSVYYELHAGGRYEVSENLGLFAELGYGLALLKAGVSLKL